MSNAVSERNLVSVLLRLLQSGDLEMATDLYEERGRSVAEQLFHKLQETPALHGPGARMYQRARDFTRGARLQQHARNWPDAARLWEDANNPAAAAECWKRAGELSRAAAALQACGQMEEATAIYAGLNQFAEQATVLARRDRWMDSAAAYRAAGNLRAELDALRAVPLEHRERVPAVKRLAEILLLRNRPDEAAQLVTEVLRDNETGRVDPELHELAAALFDRLGESAQGQRLRVRAQRLRARPAATLVQPEAAEPELETETPASETETAPRGYAPIARGEGYRYLKTIPIFSRLSLEDMRDLYRLMTEESWTPGQQLIEVGHDPPGLFVLLEGDAEVHALTPDGLRHLNSVGPGAHLGEISLLTNSITSARVTAVTLVRGLHLSRDRFDHFVSTHPNAALRIYRLFSEGLAERVRALSLA